MGKIFLEILPLALAASVNPTGVLAIVFILSLPEKPVRKAVAFILGSFVFLIALSTLIYFFLSDAEKSAYFSKNISADIDIVLGAIVLLLAIKSYLNRRRDSKPRKHKFRGSFFWPGIIYMAIDFSSLVPYIAASKIIGASQLALAPVAILFLFMIIATLLWLKIPVAVMIFFPKKSEQALGRLKEYFQEHGAELVRIMLAIISIYLIIHGVLKL